MLGVPAKQTLSKGRQGSLSKRHPPEGWKVTDESGQSGPGQMDPAKVDLAKVDLAKEDLAKWIRPM